MVLLENPLLERIRQNSEREAEVLEGLRKVKGLYALTKGMADWREDNGVVYYKGKVYVPPDLELR